jgi:hypothetical protein
MGTIGEWITGLIAIVALIWIGLAWHKSDKQFYKKA